MGLLRKIFFYALEGCREEKRVWVCLQSVRVEPQFSKRPGVVASGCSLSLGYLHEKVDFTFKRTHVIHRVLKYYMKLGINSVPCEETFEVKP